jgi:glycosyltransferase involved in cell wall biosynthesis
MGVTVVIPHKNDSALIPRALKSIRAQTYQPNQVIVIDDWSNDDQKKLLDQVIADNKAFLPIECVKSHGHGLSAARNTGIKLASQEIIAFLDCDDEWRFDKLEKQIKLFSAGYAAVHSWCTNINSNESHTLLKPTVRYSQSNLIKGDYSVTGSSSSMIMRRKAAIEVGGFNENLPSAEDIDMWVRISMHGELICAEESLVNVYSRNTGTQKNLKYVPNLKFSSHEKMISNWMNEGIIGNNLASEVLARRLISITSEYSNDTNSVYAIIFFLKKFMKIFRIYKVKFLIHCLAVPLRKLRGKISIVKNFS